MKVYKALLGLLGLMGLLVACQQGQQGGPQLGSPDFAVVLSRASVGFLGEGDTTEVLVQVVAKNGFNGPVTLSVEGLPSFLQASFNPGSVTPQSTLNVVTGLAQATLVLRAVETPPPGQNLTLQVKATSGSTAKTANLSVKTPVVVLDEDFSGGIPNNWEVVINDGDEGWRDDDPEGRYEDDDWAPWGNIVPPFAIADSDWVCDVMDTELITPSLDLTGLSRASLRFDHKFVYYSGGGDESGRVDISLDGGSTWTNLATYQGQDLVGQVVLDISSAAGQSNVKIRFHYANADCDWFWAVDNVRVLGF
jgi:hypothetical protein